MYLFLKKKKKTPIFEIDSPKISLTPNTVDFISILEKFEIKQREAQELEIVYATEKQKIDNYSLEILKLESKLSFYVVSLRSLSPIVAEAIKQTTTMGTRPL